MNEKEALLNQLRDVELPQVATTLAPGWWLLLALLVLVGLVSFLFLRQRRARLWQRQAGTEVQTIRDQIGTESSAALLSQCSQLARKVVLAVDRREQVAALNGEAWLEKLDELCARPEFSQGIGRLLLDQPYQRQPVVAVQDLHALVDSMDVLINAAAGFKPLNNVAAVPSVSSHSVDSSS